jgi:hypothetical protein
VPSGGFRQRLEQTPVCGVVFGVPLYSEGKLLAKNLNSFDRAVGCKTNGFNP